MADRSKFRLVRCPKCDNLLPENPNYSVYQCGGCGAVLKAKKKANVNDGFLEKSDEEISRYKNENVEYLSEKGNSSLGSSSDGVMEIPRVEQRNQKGIVFGYRTIDFPPNSSGSENRKGAKGFGLDPSEPRKDSRYFDEDDHSSNLRVNDWVNRYNLHERSESENLSIEKDIGGISISSPIHNSIGTFRPGENIERNGYSNFVGKSRVTDDQIRNPYCGYPDEGSSSNASDAHYGYGENMWNNGIPMKPHAGPNLEHDPAEIMRTIDELKDRLSRYCGAVEKPRFVDDRAFPDRYYYDKVSRPQTRENFYPPRLEDQFPVRMNMQPFNQSSYPYQTRVSREYDLGQRMDVGEFHTPMNNWVSHHSACSCLDCIPPPNPQNRLNPRDMLSANLNHYTSPFPHRTPGRDSTPLRELMARERWGSDPESDIDSLSGQRKPVMRQKNEQYCRSIAGGAPFIACNNCFELLKLPKNLIKGKNKVKCGACSFVIGVEIEKKRLIIGSPKESNLQSSELDGDSCYRSDDFVNSGNKSHNLKTSGQNSTVEVRESKLSLLEKKQSFSSSEGEEESPSHFIMQQNTPNKSHNLKTSEPNSTVEVRESKMSLPEKNRSFSSSKGEKESPSRFTMQQNTPNLKTSEQNSTVEVRESKMSLPEKNQSFSSSEGEESPSYFTMQQNTPNLKTSEQNSKVEVRESMLSLPEKKQSFSSSEGEEESPSHFTLQQNTPNSAEAVLSSKKPALSLDDRSDCSSEYVGDHEAIQLNRARNVHNKIQPSQNSTEDVSESSELEDSFDEYTNTQTSQDSTEIDKEEDQTKNSNGDEIILADRVKKQNVLVNGHPIPDHLVKKAEKLAGTILPGDYWYDYHAGFWGVIGHPCLGIIPPFIEEFNYPIPTNCAAGNSGVYINGRELNQNDLDLLSGRGLPTTRDRFYILDISGRVRDEDSGEELYYLGKLAPTIEKMKRGFGMKVPRLLM